MAAYRFVVFPHGAAPTAEELDLLHGYADLLDRHIAYGKHRSEGGLAIACEAEPFERLRKLDPDFEELLLHWEVRGAEVRESVPFARDPEAWSRVKKARKANKAPAAPAPKPAAKQDAPAPPARRRRVPPATERHRTDAAESVGRVRLDAARTAAQAESLERAAAWMPYALWGLGAVAVLAAGSYFGWRLTRSPGESRAETVERVAEDPIGQPLAVPAIEQADE